MRKAPMNRYLDHYNMYDIEEMKRDAEEYRRDVAEGSPNEGSPSTWKTKTGSHFTLVDWDTAIAEAEAINAAGGRGFSSTSFESEWDARGSLTGE